MSDNKGLLWVAGAIIVVMLLEYAPKLGGGLLLVLTVYLAYEARKKGVI